MALTGSAARRYAEALLALTDDPRETRAALDRLKDALGRDALRALANPSVPLQRRLGASDGVTKDQPQHVRSLVQLLVQRGRIDLLPQVATAFGDLVDRREGIQHGRITTAVELDDAEKRSYVERLEKTSGSRVQTTFAVDPSLIGGARVQVGDHLVDGSVRSQLDALRARLAS